MEETHPEGLSAEELYNSISTSASRIDHPRGDQRRQQQQQRPESDFSDTVKDIVHTIADFVLRELQKKYKVVREKEQAVDLGKTCSECKAEAFRGPYFLCLVCPIEYILCADCEAREILSDQELKTHKWKSHPFAKIKRTAQIITKCEVATINERDIPFEAREQHRQVRVRQQQPETEQEMADALFHKFEAMYGQLIERSDYHRLAFADP